MLLCRKRNGSALTQCGEAAEHGASPVWVKALKDPLHAAVGRDVSFEGPDT
jgi:hypothetical protein